MHRRETSNALDASVRCEQKRLQRWSKIVSANNWITHADWQGIPDRRTSHTESPSVIGAEPVTCNAYIFLTGACKQRISIKCSVIKQQ